jgi:hypothetical protein
MEAFEVTAVRNTDVSKCLNCGAGLLFDPENCALKCTHCESPRAIEIRKSIQLPISALVENDQTWAKEAMVVSCQNCGASEVICSGDIAQFCSFCGASHLVQSQDLAGLRPNAVVPFKLTNVQACLSAAKWSKGKIFAPSKFKKSVKAKEIHGVYNPAFTFDANTSTPFSGILERMRTETVRDRNGNTRIRMVPEQFRISGTYSHAFNEVTIQASEAISQKAVNGMQPFHTNNSFEYSEDFIRGYVASQYTKPGLQCFGEARQVMEATIRQKILAQYSYTRIVSFDMNPQYLNIQWKYVLVPVYVGHFTWKEKLFNFFVNGLTGKTFGKTPLSPLRIGFAVLMGLAVVAGAVIGALFASGNL